MDGPDIWLILQELVQRLHTYFEAEDAGPGEEPFKISFQEALPLQDFFGIVDRHHAAWGRRGGGGGGEEVSIPFARHVAT